MDTSLYNAVVPLRAIVFQIVFLLTAILTEAMVLRQELKIPHRKSIEYATSINLLSTIIGWLVFFNIQFILPTNLRVQLLNFIFFELWTSDIAFVIVSAFFTFFASFFIKLQGLNLLQLLLQERSADVQQKRRKYPSLRQTEEDSPETPQQANAILKANALSYSAILLLLLLRFLLQAHTFTTIDRV